MRSVGGIQKGLICWQATPARRKSHHFTQPVPYYLLNVWLDSRLVALAAAAAAAAAAEEEPEDFLVDEPEDGPHAREQRASPGSGFAEEVRMLPLVSHDVAPRILVSREREKNQPLLPLVVLTKEHVRLCYKKERQPFSFSIVPSTPVVADCLSPVHVYIIGVSTNVLGR